MTTRVPRRDRRFEGRRVHATRTDDAARPGGGDGTRSGGQVEVGAPRRTHGPGLVLLGLLALGRAACPGARDVPAALAGRPLDLSVDGLAGDEFRLLPGVGPSLAARLEAARVAAGGRLDPARLEQVPGVGPVLAARWRALGSDRTRLARRFAQPAGVR